MENRREFNTTLIVDKGFLQLDPSSKSTYFMLCMVANEYGEIKNVEEAVKKCGTMRDFEALVAQDFILWSEEGWAVIKDWFVHNILLSATAESSKVKGLGFSSNMAYKRLPQFKSHPLQLDDEFERLWKAYPRHNGSSKQEARKAFRNCGETADVIIAAIEKQKKSGCWSDVKYIPHLVTYLHQKRWESVEEVDDGSRARTERAAEASSRWNITYAVNGTKSK